MINRRVKKLWNYFLSLFLLVSIVEQLSNYGKMDLIAHEGRHCQWRETIRSVNRNDRYFFFLCFALSSRSIDDDDERKNWLDREIPIGYERRWRMRVCASDMMMMIGVVSIGAAARRIDGRIDSFFSFFSSFLCVSSSLTSWALSSLVYLQSTFGIGFVARCQSNDNEH